MRMLIPAAALALILFIGCSAPELQEPEPKIAMAPWPKQTNVMPVSSWAIPRTLGEYRQVTGIQRRTPFQAYDDKVTGAIQKRWLDMVPLLPRQPGGRVVLDFKITYDGRVEDLKVTETTVPDNYVDTCRKAVLDSVPYDRWPAEMRRLVGSSYRYVTMRFYYN
jgi:hypothetical protein